MIGRYAILMTRQGARNVLSGIGDAICVTTIDVETQAHLHWLVLEAHRTLPQLAVTITPHTDGKTWLVDHCCCRAWIHDSLPPWTLLDAVRAAITELNKGRHSMLGVIPQQRCNSPALTT